MGISNPLLNEIKELIKLSKDKGIVKIETTLLLKYKRELNSYSKKDKEKKPSSYVLEFK